MNDSQNISASRRNFLGNSIKLTALTVLLVPFQKALASGTAVLNKSFRQLRKFLPIDKLVLNTKTKVIHLPSGKIFSRYPTIKHQSIISSANWETEVKPPYRFNKEKSGIILEILALTRLSAGINDKSLSDAYRILSMAFARNYNDKKGLILNKYNFRLHHLLLKSIALNGTVPLAQKWGKFQQATANINYTEKDKRPLPKFMSWITNKTDFDKKANYIVQNKQSYISRLAARASRYKI